MLSCRITQLRRCAGLSQAQLAQYLHITPSSLGMYEQGRRTPSIEILVHLSKLFNVSLDYLITGEEFVPAFKNTDIHSFTNICPLSYCSHCRFRE